MHQNSRVLGGLACSDVLGLLSDYLDGELEANTRAKVDAHLRECPNCARFGGEVAGMLRALAGLAPQSAAAPIAVRQRLRLALEREGLR
ncbi:MAG: zf-HC2 domain-containing protein [Bryobacterales bacterium]|nr:zf-HC2 domain-containing protein [Bryobacterales bacterium]